MPVPPKYNAYTHRLGFLCLASQRDGQTNKQKTRMVQLPATAAIEYVAAVDACLIYIISSV